MDYSNITRKQALLNKHRPLSKSLVINLEDWFRVELTYSSNAIEGNTLTRKETALVVEKGITVGGKSLTEHLEATNHAKALEWVKDQVKRSFWQISENDILQIHSMILMGIDSANAGHYRNLPVRVAGSIVIFPNYRKVPDLMREFVNWMEKSKKLHPVEMAAEAHYRLVTIHPFVDGNGRAARLLMNMILLMTGYPPAIIRMKDRLAYIDALEKAQLGGSKESFLKLVVRAVERSLDIYLDAVEGKTPKMGEGALLKIGELAKKTKESNSTIRHWTKVGLLEVAEVTKSGYQLYSPKMVERIKKIHALKKQRYTLQQIKQKICI